jgi:carboxymethylenebutenolidase
MTGSVEVERISFEREGEPCAGLLARPATSEPAPVVVLMSAIAGINDYMERVAYSLAVAGFVCYAPDYYVREGGPPDLSSRPAIMAAVAALPDPRVRRDLGLAIDHLGEQKYAREGSIGVLGFCIGGTYALFAAADHPQLGCAVDFYGQLRYAEQTDNKPCSALDVAAQIGCPVLGHYGDCDHIVPAEDVAALRARLAGHPAEVFVYPGAGHAFHEDFRPDVYRPVAATEAWRRSLLYLDWNLRRDQLQVG